MHANKKSKIGHNKLLSTISETVFDLQLIMRFDLDNPFRLLLNFALHECNRDALLNFAHLHSQQLSQEIANDDKLLSVLLHNTAGGKSENCDCFCTATETTLPFLTTYCLLEPISQIVFHTPQTIQNLQLCARTEHTKTTIEFVIHLCFDIFHDNQQRGRLSNHCPKRLQFFDQSIVVEPKTQFQKLWFKSIVFVCNYSCKRGLCTIGDIQLVPSSILQAAGYTAKACFSDNLSPKLNQGSRLWKSSSSGMNTICNKKQGRSCNINWTGNFTTKMQIVFEK